MSTSTGLQGRAIERVIAQSRPVGQDARSKELRAVIHRLHRQRLKVLDTQREESMRALRARYEESRKE